MWIEDHELSIFCGILSDAYRDSYITPCPEFVWLPIKDLDRGMSCFKKKRQQIEDLSAGRSHLLHFWLDEDSRQVSISSEEEETFEQMAEQLGFYGVIDSSLALKKAYYAWRWLLEDNECYIPKGIQEKLQILHIQLNNSPFTEKDKHHIAIQAMSHVIAYVNGYFSIAKIKNVLLRFSKDVQEILYLDRLKSVRTYKKAEVFEPKDKAKALAAVVAVMHPIPKSERRGRQPRESRSAEKIGFVPNVFDEKDGMTYIHFPKLSIVIHYITFGLRVCKVPLEEIFEHPIIMKYKNRIPVFFHSILDIWIAVVPKQIAGL
jgi:hypothetical protein